MHQTSAFKSLFSSGLHVFVKQNSGPVKVLLVRSLLPPPSVTCTRTGVCMLPQQKHFSHCDVRDKRSHPPPPLLPSSPTSSSSPPPPPPPPPPPLSIPRHSSSPTFVCGRDAIFVVQHF
ncbi:hypothetical protein FQA47_017160 [Oryzias melastigma]|uniref:Uncharacterized protein n=1 Tax=Oryzias melastigma TaxID=30732 RepID=A0A834C1A2_ORYME|nr:hypothetical protein FQA47_017160 [Oryzias melastigma]